MEDMQAGAGVAVALIFGSFIIAAIAAIVGGLLYLGSLLC